MKFIEYKHRQISGYYHERPDSPTYLSVIIPFGTIHETPVNFGASHLVEHLICRENRKYTNLQSLKNEIAKRGIYVNAHASLDNIRVHLGIPDNNDFMFAIDLLGEMLRYPMYNANSTQIEINSIEAEIASLKNNPNKYIYNELYRKTFGLREDYVPNYGNLSRMRRLDLGNVDNIFASIQDLPITILGSGGVSDSNFNDGIIGLTANCLKKVQRLAPVVLQQKQHGVRSVIKSGGRVSIGYLFTTKVCDLASLCAFDLISEYLGNYSFGKITQQLRDEAGDSYSVDSSHNIYGEDGYLVLTTNIHSSKLGKVDELVYSSVDDLIAGNIDEQRLGTIKEMIIKRTPVEYEQTSREVINNERLRNYIVNAKKDYTDYILELKQINIDKVVSVSQQLKPESLY